MSKQLECDILEVFDKFSSLAKGEMIKSMKSAIKAGAQQLKKETLSNARAGIKTYNNLPGKYIDSILDAVRVSRLVDEYDEDLYQKVHVMGTRKKGSQTYKFRFLEGGTKDRYQRTLKGRPLKKPRYIGRITPRRYFGQAKRTVLPQLDRIFIAKINECVNKVNNSKI